MFSSLNQVIILFILHGYDCQRRIQEGIEVREEARRTYGFVVYMVKAPLSPQKYDGWLCGGAIVSKDYIVTSAACVMDILFLYAIAGYHKYIGASDLDNDSCTKDKKKKIIFICTPTAYELRYEQPEKWSNIDIAVAQVETPYDFADKSFGSCSYAPVKIDINYESKYQEPGIDALVLGWGHTAKYRKEAETGDGDAGDPDNQATLNYAATLIEQKEECKKGYEAYPGMDVVIDKYMICTVLEGNLDDQGQLIKLTDIKLDGCQPNTETLRGDCDLEEDHIILVESSRKDIKITNISRNNADRNVGDSHKTHTSSLINKINKTVLHSRRSNTRRNGICQNDHGGPLVTWVGAHLKLIGVASAYKINGNRDCIGPFLYTSTQCNGKFLDCIINTADLTKGSDVNRRLGFNCSSLLQEQGLKLVERHISWQDHPDGPADNEKNGTSPVSAVSRDTNSVTEGVLRLMKVVGSSSSGASDTTLADTRSPLQDSSASPVIGPSTNLSSPH